MQYVNLIKNKLDHIRYWWIVNTQFSQVKVLMDIGGGNRPQEIIPVSVAHYIVDPTTTIGSDIPPFVGIPRTWSDAVKMLTDCGGYNSFNRVDAVTLIDVVEHLEKEESKKLLSETIAIVNKVVVFTPNGFMPQDDGEWNTHRSGWTPQDFVGDGWEVYIFPNFHYVDFKNNILPTPHGAILAVYTGVK